MGTVYAALEVETGTPAAVKVLGPALGREEGFRERFAAEIDSLRKLNHPNIVHLLGYGTEDDYHYYVMELVAGRSLEEEIRDERRFRWRQVADIGVQVCRALKHAHDRGVIHRDVKPANLLLTTEGMVKLSDFGIAKLFGHTGLTADGGVLGTAEYMAPEQADGRPVSYRCDLYSLGGVLYALLAGRPPFIATSVPEMLQLQRFASPDPVRRFASDVPEELDEIISLLLEKDPDRRVPNALVLSRRLEAMVHGLTRHERVLPSDGKPEKVGIGTPDNPLADLPPTVPRTGMLPPSADQLRTAASDASQGSPESTHDHVPALAGGNVSQTTDMLPADARPRAGRTVVLSTPGPRKFISIGDEEARPLDQLGELATVWISPQTWALVAGLLTVGLTTWYMLQPPSADRLYMRIARLAAENKIESLADAERDIETFLTYYGGDPRRVELKLYQDQIEDYQLERRFEIRIRRPDVAASLSAVERAYLDAYHYLKMNPTLCRQKMQALVDLYGVGDELPTAMRQCLQLARRQILRLDEQLQRDTEQDTRQLEQQMSVAEEKKESDPMAAVQIWKAVIELYADRPWARSFVDRARQELAPFSTVDANRP
jgi:serine/threonine-protein kinase